MSTARSLTYEFKGKFDSLRSGLTAAGRSVDDFGKGLTKLDAKGAKARQGLTDIGNTAGKIGLLAGAGLTAVIGVATNFESAMSRVAAATGEGSAGMKALRDAALNAGADTAFSASEAAAGIENLSKAGLSTQDILAGGLKGALDLAAAGGLEVADAAEIAASALNQFNLQGADVPHVADLLASAAGHAAGEVSDYAAALDQSGLVASQFGLTIEETTGTLAALGSAGFVGSDAGTSLKSFLQALVPSSTAAKDAMEDMGFSAFDAQGKFVGMSDVAGQLAEGLSTMSEEQQAATLKTIFGSDAVRAASLIYGEGADGIQEWIDKTNDAGYAAEQAGKLLDNLAGDWEALTGSIETALIGMGEGSQTTLRYFVQGLTDTVNAFSDLPAPAKNGVTAILGLTTALGGAVFVASRVVNGMASASEALQNMGMKAETADKVTRRLSRTMGAATGIGLFAVGMSNANEVLGSFESAAGGAIAGFSVGGPWGAGIGAAVGLVASLANKADDASGEIEAFTAALDAQTGALTDNNRELATKKLQDSGVLDDAEQLGLNLAVVTDAALGNKDAIAELADEMDRYAAAIYAVNTGQGPHDGISLEDAEAASRVQAAVGDLNDVVDESTKNWAQNKTAAGGAAGAITVTNSAIDAARVAAKQAGPQFEKMSKSMKKDREAAKGTAEEFFNLGEKLDKAKVSLAGWLKSLEKQAAALADFRENAQKAARRGLDEGLIASLEKAGPAGALRMKQLADATDSEIKRANKAWREGEREIQRYTDFVGGVPKKVTTTLGVDPTNSFPTIHGVINALSSIHDKTVHINTVFSRNNLPPPGSGIADGGTVPGQRQPYGDKTLAYLAPGEEVISNRWGQADQFRADRSAGRIPAYADGGTAGIYERANRVMVSPTSSSTSVTNIQGAGDLSEVVGRLAAIERKIGEVGTRVPAAIIEHSRAQKHGATSAAVGRSAW